MEGLKHQYVSSFVESLPPIPLRKGNSPISSSNLSSKLQDNPTDTSNQLNSNDSSNIACLSQNRPSKSQRIQSVRPWRFEKPRKSMWDIKKSKTKIFQVHDKHNTKASITLRKKSNETLEHCLCKAILWALHVEKYGPMNIGVEWDIGDTYLPDVIAFPPSEKNEMNEKQNVSDLYPDFEDAKQAQKYHIPPRVLPFDPETNKVAIAPLFWGESGRMSPKKAADICLRYPHTHIVHMRWGMDGGVQHAFVDDLYKKIKPTLSQRTAPFHVVTVKGDPRQFFDEDGNISVSNNDFVWRDLSLE